jgi:hypothetical protein
MVLVAQAFLKVAILKALAPTQSDPGFIVAQLIALAIRGTWNQGSQALSS